jgi:hypothetical protein
MFARNLAQTNQTAEHNPATRMNREVVRHCPLIAYICHVRTDAHPHHRSDEHHVAEYQLLKANAPARTTSHDQGKTNSGIDCSLDHAERGIDGRFDGEQR